VYTANRLRLLRKVHMGVQLHLPNQRRRSLTRNLMKVRIPPLRKFLFGIVYLTRLTNPMKMKRK
jgi:hypothetical protein